MENIELNENSIELTSEIKEYLLETSKWSKFMAIAGFVGLGILAVLGFLMLIGLSVFDNFYQGAPIGGMGLIYIVMAVVYYFPNSYLYRFATMIKQGLQSEDEMSLTNGFLNLKKVFKFMGVLTIVILSIYALILLIAIPAFLFFIPRHV
ncbi:MAG: DUF5362 family protein [Bacteriovorax sp.]|nr:DUF5362 family protein [Bacteriovorax sp.]